MNRVDKVRVGAAFSRAAAEYDEHARVQRAVLERVLALAAEHAIAPRRALDVGAGTGVLVQRLLARFPGLLAAGVDLAPGMARAAAERTGPRHLVGDAEALPFATGALDLVVSSSTFQWLPSLSPAFAEVARVLAPGGICVIALFGAETLRELGASWSRALPVGAPNRMHRFHAEPEVHAAAEGAGLEILASGVDRHVEHEEDVLSLLRTLRRIGAGNAAPDRPRGLSEAHVVARMVTAYEELREQAGVPVTWDVVHLVGRRR